MFWTKNIELSAVFDRFSITTATTAILLMGTVHETHPGSHNRAYVTVFFHTPVFKKCVKRTRRDISRHPDSYINVTMDSIGCLNNIAYPKPTEYSMYKCQNFGTARRRSDRRAHSVVHGDYGMQRTLRCTIRTSAPPFECARGHL